MVQSKLIIWIGCLSLIMAALLYTSHIVTLNPKHKYALSKIHPVAQYPRIFINNTQRGETCLLPAGAVVITTKTTPPFQLAVYSRDDIVSNRIRSDGVWEAAVLTEIRANLMQLKKQTLNPKPRVFVDIGANIGFFTIYAAILGAHVIAFEPLKQNIELVKVSACLNGLDKQIELYGIGLKTQRGRCITVAGGANQGDAHLECTDELPSQSASDSVDVDRLDNYIRDRHVDLLKIDIEGFEQEAIESGLGVWRDPATGAPSKIVFECNRNLALERGLDTLFWIDFAREFSCSFNHYMEIGIPSWISVLPWVSSTMLTRCGGSNHGLSCPRTGTDLLLPILMYTLISLLTVICFGWLTHSIYASKTVRVHVA
jgi:FkbM family methyltransferase